MNPAHCWHAHLVQNVTHRRDYYCCRCGQDSWRRIQRGALAGHGPYYEIESELVDVLPGDCGVSLAKEP